MGKQALDDPILLSPIGGRERFSEKVSKPI
jgi:hypothetical protein